MPHREDFRTLLEHCGETQSSLARQLRVSRITVGHWVQGRAWPYPRNVRAIAAALQQPLKRVEAALEASRRL